MGQQHRQPDSWIIGKLDRLTNRHMERKDDRRNTTKAVLLYIDRQTDRQIASLSGARQTGKIDKLADETDLQDRQTGKIDRLAR